MSQKVITISLVIMLMVSFSFLALTEKKQHQIENSWFLYFENPQSDSLDFTIENHSDNNDFSWSLIVNDNPKKTGKIKVLKGKKGSVTIEKISVGEKAIIKVHSEKDLSSKEQEIYKTL